MMFEAYSERARQVIFLARLKAGQRGAKAICVDDLIAALVIEDQGNLPNALLSGFPQFKNFAGQIRPPSHPPLFTSEAASSLLQSLDRLLDRAIPLPPESDVPMSSDLKHVLEAAAHLAEEFQHAAVQPSHMLAAVAEQASKGAQLLRESGITRERVMDAIRQQQ